MATTACCRSAARTSRARATRSSARAWSSSSAWCRGSRARTSRRWRRVWSRADTAPKRCGSSSRRWSGPAAGAESTPFRARLSRSGQLLNNGIVATEAFLDDLEQGGGWRSLRRFVGGDGRFVVIELEDARECLDLAIRPLGRADLKGLPSPLLFEMLDGDLLGDGVLERLQAPTSRRRSAR